MFELEHLGVTHGRRQLGVGDTYAVALVSRIDTITGLFCKRALYKRRYSAQETYRFIDATDGRHAIVKTRRT